MFCYIKNVAAQLLNYQSNVQFYFNSDEKLCYSDVKFLGQLIVILLKTVVYSRSTDFQFYSLIHYVNNFSVFLLQITLLLLLAPRATVRKTRRVKPHPAGLAFYSITFR